jgi:methionyl-tRNA formyltransferase
MEALDLLSKGRIKPVPQDHTRATYAPALTKEEGRIDWDQEAKTIHNLIRGLVPWPCAYTYLNGKMLKILSASHEPGDPGVPCGTLMKDRAGIRIACKAGFIIPHTLQLEGKKALDGLAFSCGLKTEQIVVGR